MAKTKDHMFLIAESKESTGIIGWAFHPVDENELPQIKHKIETIFEKHSLKYEAHYLGSVNYEAMDRSIVNYLDQFQKFDKLWLQLDKKL